MAEYLSKAKEIIKGAPKEVALIGGDAWVASVGESGLGVDWSQGSLFFKGSSIFLNLGTYTKPLGGALYEVDKNGFKRRVDGANNDPYVDEYNEIQRKVVAAGWRAVEEELKRVMPSNKNLPFLDPIPVPGLGVNMCYREAKGWRQPIDPLMLDLDGDGLELKAATGAVLFDHDADGVRTGTGWLGADDGILVRDADGNGFIDTGRELFGVEAVKNDGKKAVNGFEALADLDSSRDGCFSDADGAWSQVKIWRDLNQNGISESAELFDLDQLGIGRIGVVGSATNTTGGANAGAVVNGNLIAHQVQNLVQAMAAFSPPAAGQTTLPAVYQKGLAPVIAANWH